MISTVKDEMFVTNTGERFLPHEVTFCKPEKYDMALVMEGEDKGIRGLMISVDESLATIKGDEGKTYKVDIKRITKAIQILLINFSFFN